MRKIKLTLKCRVPSWGYCNYDGFTANNRPSKELCRFCTKDKNGYKCLLHDERLATKDIFVMKSAACVDATAGFAITADEEPTPHVDPKSLIKEALNGYTQLVAKLIKQGYPRAVAEQVAKKYMLE